MEKEDWKVIAVIIGSLLCILNIFYILYLQYESAKLPSLATLYDQKYYIVPLFLWCGLIVWGGDSKNF